MAEKTISEVTPDVRGLFEKGNEALERSNVDYALTLFHPRLAVAVVVDRSSAR